MILVPMDSAIETKLVSFKNASSVTIGANNSANVVLSTSDDDLSGWIPMGIINYNTYQGEVGRYALKAVNYNNNNTINAFVMNGTASSITLAANKVTMDIRFLKE